MVTTDAALKIQGVGVVVPAYQASGSLASVLQGLQCFLPATQLLVVDDGSTDRTSDIAKAQGAFCLRHEINRGKGAALMSGLLHARHLGWRWAVTVDADGQHTPEDLQKFLVATPRMDTGIIVGSRPRLGTAMPWPRRFSNSLSTWMVSRLAGKPVFDAQSGFRAYRTDILEGYRREGRFEWEPQALILCCRQGYGVEKIPIRTVYSGQESHIRLGRDIWRFLCMAGRLAWTR